MITYKGYYSGIISLSLAHPVENKLSSRRKNFKSCHTLRKTSMRSMKNTAEGMKNTAEGMKKKKAHMLKEVC